MPVKTLVEEVSAAEIFEWMAYDMLQNEDFNKKITKELEMEKQASMSEEERSKLLINMFKQKG